MIIDGLIVNGRRQDGGRLSSADMRQLWRKRIDEIGSSKGVRLGNLYQNRKAGNEILDKYCSSCGKSEKCEMFENVKKALGANGPLWYESHIPVFVDGLPSGEGHVFCCEYESPQKNLPEMEEPDRNDGMERLLEVVGIVVGL